MAFDVSAFKYRFEDVVPPRFCEEIRRISEMDGITVDGILRRIKSSPDQYESWDNGTSCPKYSVIEQLVSMGADECYILTGRRSGPGAVMRKKIDVIEVKAAVKGGQIVADVRNGLIRLTDTVSGERVVIGKVGESE